MEHLKKTLNRQSIIYALVYGATYLPAAWLLKHKIVGQPLSVIIAVVPVIAFAVFIYKYLGPFRRWTR